MMKRLLIALTAGLFAVTTAQAEDKALRVCNAGGHAADIPTWESYYGKPAKIEDSGKGRYGRSIKPFDRYHWKSVRILLRSPLVTGTCDGHGD